MMQTVRFYMFGIKRKTDEHLTSYGYRGLSQKL